MILKIKIKTLLFSHPQMEKILTHSLSRMKIIDLQNSSLFSRKQFFVFLILLWNGEKKRKLKIPPENNPAVQVVKVSFLCLSCFSFLARIFPINTKVLVIISLFVPKKCSLFFAHFHEWHVSFRAFVWLSFFQRT